MFHDNTTVDFTVTIHYNKPTFQTYLRPLTLFVSTIDSKCFISFHLLLKNVMTLMKNNATGQDCKIPDSLKTF